MINLCCTILKNTYIFYFMFCNFFQIGWLNVGHFIQYEKLLSSYTKIRVPTHYAEHYEEWVWFLSKASSSSQYRSKNEYY